MPRASSEPRRGVVGSFDLKDGESSGRPPARARSTEPLRGAKSRDENLRARYFDEWSVLPPPRRKDFSRIRSPMLWRRCSFRAAGAARGEPAASRGGGGSPRAGARPELEAEASIPRDRHCY